jgi:hypothetical protein
MNLLRNPNIRKFYSTINRTFDAPVFIRYYYWNLIKLGLISLNLPGEAGRSGD